MLNKSEDILIRFKRLKTKTDLITDKIENLWHKAIKENNNDERCLIHGDLHPGNIIVNENKIEAIIDWGDITCGDPATDLASLWMLFENKKNRDEALAKYGANDKLILRAKGWAIFFGTILLDTGLNSNQKHAKVGSFTLKNLNNE